MRDQRLWTWHIGAGVVILVLLGLHMTIMHLDGIVRVVQRRAGGTPIDWANVVARGKSVVLPGDLRPAARGGAVPRPLRPAEHPLRAEPRRGRQEGVNGLLLLGGLGLFVVGTWAAWAAYSRGARRLPERRWTMAANEIADRRRLFRIRRFDPSSRRRAPLGGLPLPVHAGHDRARRPAGSSRRCTRPTLAWRSSCRMGVCGSCGMFINGRPRLACNTQVSELGTALVTVAPLPELRHHPRPGARPRAR